MKSTNRQLKVFVSSTSEDLQDYRAVARNVILSRGWMPIMMEYFGTDPSPTVAACQEKLAQCQLVLLIVAFRRGWVPTKEQGGNGDDSITALEFAFARKQDIPVRAMLATKETWPGSLWEDEQVAREWVKRFRDGLNKLAAFFAWEPATTAESTRLAGFRAKVSEVLVDHEESLLAQEMESRGSGAGLDFFETAEEGLIQAVSIPFLGQGIYGEEGPFSTKSLVRAMLNKTPIEQECLATAAEYRDRRLGHRPLFLTLLRKIIEEQQAQAARPLIYDVLTRIKAPPLIVSTTHDLGLERALEADGKSYILLTHILHSRDGRHDGKIFCIKGRQYDICPADKTDVGMVDYIIYKPLGSPLVHDLVDPQMQIDTVVITETDLVTFLGRLQHQETGVPTSLGRLFQSQPLLFMGYPLDVWHYRLVLQVFKTTGSQSSRLAVRKPNSVMEELAWQRLGIDLIHMDTDDFVSRISTDLDKPKIHNC